MTCTRIYIYIYFHQLSSFLCFCFCFLLYPLLPFSAFSFLFCHISMGEENVRMERRKTLTHLGETSQRRAH